MTNKVARIILGLTGIVTAITAILPEAVSRVPLRIRIIIGLCGVILLILSWIFEKFWPPLISKINYFFVKQKRRRIGIAFDIETNDDIVKYCNEEISKLGLGTKILFKSYKVSERSEAKFKKLVSSSNLDVMVWTRKLPRAGNVPLNFTYKDTIDRTIGRIVHYEISDMMSKEKAFSLYKDTISVDLRAERNNIMDFSLYIVALYITIFRGYKEGLLVFEKLEEKIKKQDGVLKENTLRKLKDIYVIQGCNFVFKKRYPEGVELLEKGYAISPKDKNLLAALALAKFHLGDESRAEKLASELLQNHTGFSIAHLDAAFFRIKNKNYPSALKHYQLYSASKPEGSISLPAITFLSERFDESPTELGYLFGTAYLKNLVSPKSEKVGESTCREDFTSFMRRADEVIYKVFIDHIKKHKYSDI